MATITNQDLIERIAVRLGSSEAEVGEATQRILDEIVQELSHRHRIDLGEFGTFDVKTRAPRKARNPQSGECVLVPAREAICFTADWPDDDPKSLARLRERPDPPELSVRLEIPRDESSARIHA